MDSRVLALFLLVILPGAGFMGISTYYLFPEWATLTKSVQNDQTLAQNLSTSERALSLA